VVSWPLVLRRFLPAQHALFESHELRQSAGRKKQAQDHCAECNPEGHALEVSGPKAAFEARQFHRKVDCQSEDAQDEKHCDDFCAALFFGVAVLCDLQNGLFHVTKELREKELGNLEAIFSKTKSTE